MTTLEGWERLARLNPITLAVLQEHARRVAAAIGVTVHHASSDYIRGNRVYGPGVTDERSYARFLHEAGHHETTAAERHGVTFVKRFQRVNTAGESAAWTWAKRHALCWSDTMQNELRRCLQSYWAYARLGVADRIWRELDRVDGHLTVGHAKWRLDTVGCMSVEEGRRRLAQLTRR
jgi:hypothetical protein